MARTSNRRELIISIATTRFLISGYDNVTVDELCELSGSTKGSFYHFFSNKEALAVDVVNSVWHQIEGDLEENFFSKDPVLVILDREVERIASNFIRFDGRRYFIGCAIGTLGVSLRGKSLKLTRRLNFAMTHMRQFYLDAFERGLSRGEVGRHSSAPDLADRFQLSLQGLSTLGKTHSNPIKIKHLRAQVRATLD